MGTDKMPTTVLEHVKGEDLKETLEKRISVEADSVYTITVNLIKEEKKDNVPTAQKGKWAKIAERIEKESYLKGYSEEVVKDIRKFRDNFSL